MPKQKCRPFRSHNVPFRTDHVYDVHQSASHGHDRDHDDRGHDDQNGRALCHCFLLMKHWQHHFYLL